MDVGDCLVWVTILGGRGGEGKKCLFEGVIAVTTYNMYLCA